MRDNDIAHMILARVKGAVAEAQSLGLVAHAGLRGKLRELILRQLITPVLPPTCIAVSGTTVDTYQRQQNQKRLHTEDDILIVDRELIAPILFSEGSGVIPYDGVLCRLEVKSRLTSPELKDSINAAKEYRSLKLISRIDKEETQLAPQMIIAFESDLKGNEHERYLRMLREIGTGNDRIPPIQGLCILDKGFWFFGQKENSDDMWMNYSPVERYSELVVTLGIMLNGIPTLRAQRHCAYSRWTATNDPLGARFGDYVVDPDALKQCKCVECKR